METKHLETSDLCALAKDLTATVQQYQQSIKTNLRMYSHQENEWDEIYVVAEDDDGQERMIVRVSLNHLTPVERRQLQLTIGLQNECVGSGVLSFQANSSA